MAKHLEQKKTAMLYDTKFSHNNPTKTSSGWKKTTISKCLRIPGDQDRAVFVIFLLRGSLARGISDSVFGRKSTTGKQ